ncbi:rCG42563, partial [Rattus norvegicus]
MFILSLADNRHQRLGRWQDLGGGNRVQGSACLCLLGAKVVRHNTCPIPPMVSFTS